MSDKDSDTDYSDDGFVIYEDADPFTVDEWKFEDFIFNLACDVVEKGRSFGLLDDPNSVTGLIHWLKRTFNINNISATYLNKYQSPSLEN